jgi:hypothetical protein
VQSRGAYEVLAQVVLLQMWSQGRYTEANLKSETRQFAYTYTDGAVRPAGVDGSRRCAYTDKLAGIIHRPRFYNFIRRSIAEPISSTFIAATAKRGVIVKKKTFAAITTWKPEISPRVLVAWPRTQVEQNSIQK